MAGLNYVTLSGNVASNPGSNMRRPGPWVKFLLQVTGAGPDGSDNMVLVPLVAWGRRAQRCLDGLQMGDRIVVSGRLVEDEHGIACFADWIEFVNGRVPDGGEEFAGRSDPPLRR